MLFKKSVAPPVKVAAIHLLYQFVIDAFISSLLQFRAYAELGFTPFAAYPIEFLNLFLAVLFMGASLGVALFSAWLIQTTEDLEAREFQLSYSIFVDGLKVDRKVTAQYHNMVICRKILLCLVLIVIQNGCI